MEPVIVTDIIGKEMFSVYKNDGTDASSSFGDTGFPIIGSEAIFFELKLKPDEIYPESFQLNRLCVSLSLEINAINLFIATVSATGTESKKVSSILICLNYF